MTQDNKDISSETISAATAIAADAMSCPFSEVTALLSKLAQKDAELARLNDVLKEMRATMESMKATIATLQRLCFGHKSEKVVADNSQPLLPGMETLLIDDQPQEQPTTPVAAHDRRHHEGQKNAGWNGFPDNLPREIVDITLPDAETRGLQLKRWDTSERLVHRREYIVRVIRRAVYGDRNNPAFGETSAPAPRTPVCLGLDGDRCHYDASVVVHAIVEKLVYHVPFYRQSTKFATLGLQIGRSVLCGYWAKVAEGLSPLYRHLCAMVMAAGVIHADETRVEMLDPGGGKTKTCWVWVRVAGVGPRLVAFHFSPDRSKKTAHALFQSYDGTIVHDCLASYDDLPAEAAYCWAHARREFFEARQSAPEPCAHALALISRLYEIDREAKRSAEGKSSETALFKARKTARVKSAPIVKEYFELCGRIIDTYAPSLPVTKAAKYSAGHEDGLKKFLSDSRLNIDNNLAENVVRPWCIGRKNWLFVGNEIAGRNAAILESFAATCKECNVDFETWLLDAIYEIDRATVATLPELMPHVWKKRHGAE